MIFLVTNVELSPHVLLLLAVVTSSALSILATLGLATLYGKAKQDTIADHLKITWNILAGYRNAMPPEPQPMDAAIGHLQFAITALIGELPTGNKPPPDQEVPGA